MSIFSFLTLLAAAALCGWIWRSVQARRRARRARRDLGGELDAMEQEFRQHILNVRAQLVDARQKLAVAVADEKRFKRQLENEEALARTWAEKAREIESLEEARDARDRAAAFEQRAEETRARWQEQVVVLRSMRQRLGELAGKIEDLKKRRNLVQVEAARVALGESLDRLDGDASFKAMEDLISEMEDLVR